MNWTEEQRQAIEIRDKSMLVSAAAGSGKTAVLVERIKQLISKDGLSLDELLVVTFTNAAASEMREKIVSAIPEQMSRLHKAHISTFHSFALEVIRRYFHLIDAEPDFRVCDDAQRILLQNEAMDQLFRDRFQKQDGDFLHFLKLYAGSKNEEAAKGMIFDVHRFIQSLPEPFAWLENKIDILGWDEGTFRQSLLFREMLADIDEELEPAVSDCRRVLQLISDWGLSGLGKKALADLDMTEGIRNAFREDFDKGARLLAAMTFQRFVASGEEKSGYAEIREDVAFLRDRVKGSLKGLAAGYFAKPLCEYISEMNQTHQTALILRDLVLEFHEIYQQKKKKKGVMDFSDIEHFALEILSDEAAAKEYRDKFRYIFIDEYQDSNLVQEAIISKIQRRDNLFMVGDVKQSIYKFRLAEPEIFLKKYETFRAGEDPSAVKLDLNRNFRSKAPVINTVNHIFSLIMDRRSAGMDYDEAAALNKGVSYEGPLAYQTELHLVEDRQIDDDALDDEIAAMKKAELEAQVAVNLIKQNRGLPYYDEKMKKERRLSNKDMVILLRSASGVADIYYEALGREGIPAYMDTGDGYFDTMEISVFLNLLRVIDNRKQDVPLLSVLRSPVFGFSIDELAEIRCACKKKSYFNAFSDYSMNGERQELRLRCEEALRSIEKWRQRAKFLMLPDFLWELIRETGYYDYAGALPGGMQRQGHLRALVDKGAAYEAGSGKGLFGFINYVEAIKKGKVAAAPTRLIGESDDVVRIMTVHKSKGLEFPLILVGGLGREFHGEKAGPVSCHKDLGIAIRRVDRDLRCYSKTLLQNIIETRQKREGMAEEIRILYVALTRPMDKLILLGSIKDAEAAMERVRNYGKQNSAKARRYLDLLLPALQSSKEIALYTHDRGGISIEKKEGLGSGQRIRSFLKKGFEGEELPYSTVEERLGWSYRFAGALKSKSKYTVSELSSRQTGPTRRTIGTEVALSAKGAERGSVYHEIMEKIPFPVVDEGLEGVKAFAESLIAREVLTQEQVGSVDLTRILRFFESPLGLRLRKADRVGREEAFNLTRERDGEKIIVQGIIDCYFVEKGKCVLIDFKSNYVGDQQKNIDGLTEVYRPQLELYKEALEQIRGFAVDEMYLYLFSADRAVKL